MHVIKNYMTIRKYNHIKKRQKIKTSFIGKISLKKENPQIEDLNKIRKNQRVNIPVRRQTFFEKYIAGKKTKPSTRKVETSRGAEELAVKKGAEGRVYEGMSKAEMKAISNRRGGGAVMKSRGGTFKGTF